MPGKSKNNLKPIPADKKKSLGKLPTDVRNKMGYQMAFTSDQFKTMGGAADNTKPYKMDSSHSFKMKAADNMKTMYMGSVYSMNHPGKGDYVVDENELKKIEGDNIVPEGTKDTTGFSVTVADAPDFKTVKTPGSTTTVPGKVIKASKERCGIEVPMSDPRCVAYSNMSQEDIIKSEISQGLREPDKVISTPGSETTTATQGKKEIPQTYDVFDNYQSRQRSRRVIAQERKAKRAGLKTARIKGGYTNKDGDFVKFESGKNKREYKKELKAKSAEIRNRRLQEIAKQGEMQDIQGLRPGSVRSIKDGITSDYTPTSFNRDAVTGIKELDEKLVNQMKPYKMSMNLSPKAMNYFNRKNKK